MDVLRVLPWWSYLAMFAVMVVLWRRSKVDDTRGKVIGIVGRMGSGKSYFAVRMAYSRMMRGATVYSNFSMRLEPRHAEPCPAKCEAKGRCRCARHCPCQLAARWHRFEGWEQFLTISHAVVIIDEVDLYAPSHDPRAISDAVRWKLKMARKHKIDLYWIAQHEKKVSSMLRDVLSNEIRVCQSWFGGLYFTAKIWDPSLVRRRRRHIGRSGYLFRKHVANLYDTLETIRGDTERGDGTMAVANAMADAHEAHRAAEAAIEAKPSTAGKCLELRADGKRRCRNRTYGPDAESEEGRCPSHGGHDPRAERAAALKAAAAAAKAKAGAKPAPTREVARGKRVPSRVANGGADADPPGRRSSGAEEEAPAEAAVGAVAWPPPMKVAG